MIQRVLIAKPGEVIVAGIRVTTPAVGQVVADGMIIVALNALNFSLVEQRENTVGMGPEGAQIAEAKTGVHPAFACISQRRRSSAVITVNSTYDRDAAKLKCPVL